jgi:uridine kinase
VGQHQLLRAAPEHTVPTTVASVVLLGGPSGSGKSTFAATLAGPTLRLDDFYRDGTDPELPTDADGNADWEAPEAWHAERALAAVVELARTGAVTMPRYDIAANAAVSTYRVELDGARSFVAEGLFADRLVDGCREAGVLGDAIVLSPSPSRTALRRFTRDVSEGRKSVPLLMRRGMRLWREHPQVVNRCLAAGMRTL